jgi:hypothetical protein
LISITFTEAVTDPGTFNWLAFRNGRFGVFTATKQEKCKTFQVRLQGKCRPRVALFGKGSKTGTAAGTISFTVKPSRSATKALAAALKKGSGVAVTATLTYQSARGGGPLAHTRTINDKLTKAKKQHK